MPPRADPVRHREDGQGLAEYALILSLIVIFSIARLSVQLSRQSTHSPFPERNTGPRNFRFGT